MKISITSSLFVYFLLPGMLVLNSCRPIRNLKTPPAAWQGNSEIKSKTTEYSSDKKNVFIIADSKLTVLFDLIAPFYLFNATEKANVYIVAKDKTPIYIKKDLYVKPQLTFQEVDSMKIQADVIVIPALSKRDEHQDTVVINWIKTHFFENTKMLAVCDGASTAAATGLYDGKPITCHASDYGKLKKHFSKPIWIKNAAVVKSGNLFSTAGVSNAVEGSLTVINELFDRETMQKVMATVYYPGTEIKSQHQSIALNGSNFVSVIKKMMFKKNKRLGILIEDGVNEFDLASVLEVYGRSFPASFASFNLHHSTVTTKYGLTLFSTGNVNREKINELHLLEPGSFSKEEELNFSGAEIIRYDNLQKSYLIDICLKNLSKQYGHQFEKFIKISMDYN